MKIIKKFNYMFLSFLFVIICSYNAANAAVNNPAPAPAISTPIAPILTPDGVNFSNLVLEDWFLSDPTVGHDVTTTCADSKIGIGSSNLFIADTFKNEPSKQKPDFKWTSETDLIKKLQAIYSDEDIETIFQHHRDTYLGKKADGSPDPTLSVSLEKAKKLGIKIVRLPIPWAIQYESRPYSIVTFYPDALNTRVMHPIPASTGKIQLISDPFYHDLKWASIPSSQIEAILKEANKHGIKIILDIHTYPGGASDGTYNGVWPLAPMFWSTTDYQENFQTIFGNLIKWAERLKVKDPDAFAALEGLTPMNEPAHLMGALEASAKETDLKKKAVCSVETGRVPNWGITKPQEVLDTLAWAVKDFKSSSLPTDKVKLYMNVIETMYDSSNKTPFKTIGIWWLNTTTPEERKTWAVLDIHHYVAWSPDCNNVLDPKATVVAANRDDAFKIKKDVNGNLEIWQNGVAMLLDTDGNAKTPGKDTFIPMTYLTNKEDSYTINNYGLGQIRNCSDWFPGIRGQLGLDSKNSDGTYADQLATSEFSAGTNADTWRSGSSGKAQINGKPMNITNSIDYRNAFLEEQIRLAKEANITAIFWTWKVPNENFQQEWSASDIYNTAN